MHAITTTGLTKYYEHRRLPFVSPTPPVRALELLDITVREGEIFGFLGPNGAGKSTTIRCRSHLHPTAGSGYILDSKSATAWRFADGRLPPGGIALTTMTERLLDYLAELRGGGPFGELAPIAWRFASFVASSETTARHAPEDPGTPTRP